MNEPCINVSLDSSSATFTEQVKNSNAALPSSSSAYIVNTMNNRRKLTTEEVQEAARLKATYEDRKAAAKAAGGNLTQAIVAERCGWGNQSAFGHYVTGRLPLNLEALLSISKALKFDPELVSPRLTKNLPLKMEEPGAPFDVSQQGGKSNVEDGPELKGFVPLISWVQAGAWCEVEDVYAVGDAEEWMPCPTTHGPRTYVLRVRGESMFNAHARRSFRDGDLIFCDPDKHAENGSMVIVKIDDSQEATFKQLVIEGDQRFLKPLNPAWPEPIIKVNGNATFCGVVIGKYEPF